jgi:adenylate cyclase
MVGGDWEAARQALEYAIRLNPHTHIGASSLLAEIYFQLGRVDEALSLWEEIRARNPTHLHSRVCLIDHYVSVGQLDGAREIAREVLRSKPDFDARMARRSGQLALDHVPEPELLDNLRAAGLLGGTSGADRSGDSSRPGIAVLPFCNLSNDPEQEYFSDGVTEDLTAVLSRSRDLLVISRSSSSRYECQPSDLKQVGRELGVAYVVEGSVRRAQDRVRITAQLIDATTDVHVWSESYERDLSPANVFEIQSDIASQIANALQVQLREWEGQRPTTDPTAWDLYMRAVYLFRRAANWESQLASRRLLERAIELDPGFAPAHAMLAGTLVAETAHAVQIDTELLDRAENYARRAIALDPQDAEGYVNLSVALLAQGKSADAIREARRAIELNASFDVAYFTLGRSQMRLGQLAEAKRSFDSTQQLNPRITMGFFWGERGTLHYLEQEIEQAVESWERARTMASMVYPDRIMLTHHYESVGRHEDAQAIVQEMLSVQPEITAETGVGFLARYWNEEWIPDDLEAQLRSAGLP